MVKWLVIGDFENRFFANVLQNFQPKSEIIVEGYDYGSGFNFYSWDDNYFSEYEKIIVIPSVVEQAIFAKNEESFQAISYELLSNFIVNAPLKKYSDRLIIIGPGSFFTEMQFIDEINHRNYEVILEKIRDDLKEISKRLNILFIDGLSISRRVGYENSFDIRNYLLAKTVGTELYIHSLCKAILSGLIREKDRIKLLICDLDNTLWYGILTDDGPSGVTANPGDRIGQFYYFYQKIILRLTEHGVMLAVCSKNDLQLVKERFSMLQENLLKYDSFVVVKASWRPKSEMIHEILDAVNLRPSNVLFIDDSDFELAEVENSFPGEINTLKITSDPKKVLAGIESFFPRLIPSDDKENQLRVESIRLFEAMKEDAVVSDGGYENFLSSLEINVQFQEVNNDNLNRIVSLVNKTNQFNLNGKDISINSVAQRISQEDQFLFAVLYEDKLGALGVIGVVGGSSRDCLVDIFVMSCRVLGRKVEDQIINLLCNRLKCQESELKLSFVDTGKNKKLKEFLLNKGMI
jgi:FkbH-like protein